MTAYGVAPAPPALNPQGFATGLLHSLGDPTTPANVQGITAWEGKEGGNWHNTAHFNPLNTTESAPGATAMNGVGVKAYQNWGQGLNATKATLENGHYGDILQSLHAGRGLAGNLAGLRTWSGGGYSSVAPANYTEPATPSAGGTTYSLPRAAGATAPTETRQQYVQEMAKGIIARGGAGDFADLFNAALAKHPYNSTATLAPGVTQQIPSEHLGTLATGGSNDPHNLALAGALAISHDPRLGQFNQLVQSADAVANQHLNYEWGGGHNPSFAPTSGSGHGSGPGTGYDCSGVLSHVLHMAGLLNQPLVSGQFADLGKYVPSAQPGPGSGPHAITIYANPEHTYANIGGTYFGTSSENRGGGAGWIGATTENNNADYTVWHINF